MFEPARQTTRPIRDSDVVKGEALAALPGVRHAFFTRRGGASRDLYAGLNVGAGSRDHPADVEENRGRAMAYLGLGVGDLAAPWQVHSADKVVVEAPFVGERPRADAVVTRTPNLAVAVVTADCGPVLLADPVAGVVGAAHAGWRGALGGVLEAVIDAMERCGATRRDMRAVLGPTITAARYEVGADMADGFLAADPHYARFFSEGRAAGKRHFDLPGFIVARLEKAGVEADFVGNCTYGEEDAFFSYRRATHRGEADYGRQMSAITLEG